LTHPSICSKISHRFSNSEFQLIGNLKIKEITKPIEFTFVISEEAYHADLIFDRSDYNVKFRSGTFFENLGDKLILDDIELKVTLKK
jgi:polyisoprenoid-binding protein YceI